MKTETAPRATERVKLQTAPVYFVRFSHVKTPGAGVDFAFSHDFSTGPVASITSFQKYPYLARVTGGQSQVVTDQGRATIGGFVFTLTDVGGAMVKYCSNPQLTLKTSMPSGASPGVGGYIEVNETTGGYPDPQGCLEITTGGVIERVLYDVNDTVNKRFRVQVRGYDATTAAAHTAGDLINNGEQIRPGQRAQLFAGYDTLADADYMSFAKMQVVDRRLDASGLGLIVECADIQRTLRKQVFLSASAATPVYNPSTTTYFYGHPLQLALTVLLSTGAGTNWSGAGTNYDVLPVENGLGIPYQLVDVAAFEALRDGDFAGAVYQFRIEAPQDGKTWLENEIFKPQNCYPVVTQTGKYSIRRYQPALAAGSVTETLTNADLVSAQWQAGDRQIVNRVLVEYDLNRGGSPGTYGKRRLYTFNASVAKYGPSAPLVLSSAGLQTAESTVTLTIASPGVVTWTAHPFANGDGVLFTTTGALPTGVTAGTVYFVKNKAANTFELAATSGGASINTSGSQSGVHTGARATEAWIDERAFTVGKRFADPPAILRCTVFYRKHLWEVGDLVKVTYDKIPDLRTGLRGLTNEVFEIVDLQPSFGAEGKLVLTLLHTGAITIPGAPTGSEADQAGPIYLSRVAFQNAATVAVGTTEVETATVTITLERATDTLLIQGRFFFECEVTTASDVGLSRLRLTSTSGTLLDGVSPPTFLEATGGKSTAIRASGVVSHDMLYSPGVTGDVTIKATAKVTAGAGGTVRDRALAVTLRSRA